MFRKLYEKKRGEAQGFTLVELLVVIVILGILAAVVVFAVGGITDKGTTSACRADTSTLESAEEAFFANANTSYYTTEAGLVSSKLLKRASSLHDITLNTDPGATLYTVTDAGTCGAN